MSNLIDATESRRLDLVTAYTSTVLGHLDGDMLELALAGTVKRGIRSDAALRQHALEQTHPDDLLTTLITRGHNLASVGIESIQISM